MLFFSGFFFHFISILIAQWFVESQTQRLFVQVLVLCKLLLEKVLRVQQMSCLSELYLWFFQHVCFRKISQEKQ